MPRVAVLCFVLAAACSSAATTTTGTAPPITTLAATPPLAPVPPATTVTAAPATTTSTAGFTVDDHVDWFLALLNGDPATRAGYQERFDETFRGVVPFEAFVAPLVQLRGAWSIAAREASGEGAEVRFDRADGLTVTATFSQEPAGTGRLRGLVLQPAESAPPRSLDELAARWESLAPQAALLVTREPVPGEPCPVETGVAIQDQLAIGSVFKLWVLHALAAAVADGDAAWDEVLAVRDELKSLPSGTMQDEPAGTEFTLEEHAELMISISDNTATDHLIARLGRENVEAAVAATGHAEPERNRPFFTARELFWLKLLAPDDVVATYLAGDEAARRDILEGVTFDLAGVDPAPRTDPVEIETLEWFASAVDVCGALAALLDDFVDTPVTGILTANPGVRVDATTWPQVAFKGGSEPGVLALAWNATRADGEAFVIVGILNDPESLVDEITAVLLAEQAFELLADL